MKQDQTSKLLENIKKLMKLGSDLDGAAAEYPDFCYVFLASEQISHVSTICEHQLYLLSLSKVIEDRYKYEYRKKRIADLSLKKAQVFVCLKGIETTKSMITNGAALSIIDEAIQVIQLSLGLVDKILENLRTDMKPDKLPDGEKKGV